MTRTAGADAWVRAGLRQLARSGIETVKVEALARALGVTKGSFYWHFADRAALLAGMLATWEQRGTLDVIMATEASGGTPADQLRALVARAFGAPAVEERALRAWAAHDPRAAQVLARVDRLRLRYIAQRMRAHGLPAAAAEARSRMLYAAYVGEQQLAGELPPRRRVALALAALDILLAG
jgi:AcrR family transcriptional regulator